MMKYDGMKWSDAVDKATRCDRCNKPLEGSKCSRTRYYNSTYVVQEVICPICDINQYLHEYYKDHRLNNKVIEHAQIHDYHQNENPGGIASLRKEYQSLYSTSLSKDENKILRDQEKLYNLSKEWEQWIWKDSLEEYYSKSDRSTHSGTLGNIELSMLGSAGRVMFTMTDKEYNQVTLLCHENSTGSSMYLRSIDASYTQAVRILKQSIDNFNINNMKVDTNVSLF